MMIKKIICWCMPLLVSVFHICVANPNEEATREFTGFMAVIRKLQHNHASLSQSLISSTLGITLIDDSEPVRIKYRNNNHGTISPVYSYYISSDRVGDYPRYRLGLPYSGSSTFKYYFLSAPQLLHDALIKEGLTNVRKSSNAAGAEIWYYTGQGFKLKLYHCKLNQQICTPYVHLIQINKSSR